MAVPDNKTHKNSDIMGLDRASCVIFGTLGDENLLDIASHWDRVLNQTTLACSPLTQMMNGAATFGVPVWGFAMDGLAA